MFYNVKVVFLHLRKSSIVAKIKLRNYSIGIKFSKNFIGESPKVIDLKIPKIKGFV